MTRRSATIALALFAAATVGYVASGDPYQDAIEGRIHGYSGSAYAQEPAPGPAPEPTPADDVTPPSLPVLVVPTEVRPNQLIPFEVKGIRPGDDFDLGFLVDFAPDEQRLRVDRDGVSGVAIHDPGTHTIAVYGHVAGKRYWEVRSVTIAPPKPPEPSKTLKELAGSDAAQLAATLRSAAADAVDVERYPTAESWLNVYREMLRVKHVRGQLTGTAAEPEIERKLTLAIGGGSNPFDRVALAVAVDAILAELDAPDVDPTPDPTPPTPGPVPIAADGFRVLIVEETANRSNRTPEQRAAMDSRAAGSLRAYLESHCVKGTDGSPELLMLDDDNDISNLPAHWQQAWALRPREGDGENSGNLPWMAASNGKVGYVGPLTSTAQALQVLTPIGGN